MDILAEINRVMELESRALGRLREAVGPAYEKAVHNINKKKGGEGAVHSDKV